MYWSNRDIANALDEESQRQVLGIDVPAIGAQVTVGKEEPQASGKNTEKIPSRMFV